MGYYQNLLGTSKGASASRNGPGGGGGEQVLDLTIAADHIETFRGQFQVWISTRLCVFKKAWPVIQSDVVHSI